MELTNLCVLQALMTTLVHLEYNKADLSISKTQISRLKRDVQLDVTKEKLRRTTLRKIDDPTTDEISIKEKISTKRPISAREIGERNTFSGYPNEVTGNVFTKGIFK